MGREEAQRLLGLALGLVDHYHRMSDFAVETYRAALQFDHPVYDMYYLVLARHMGAMLVTLDRKLARVCDEAGVDCVHETKL